MLWFPSQIHCWGEASWYGGLCRGYLDSRQERWNIRVMLMPLLGQRLEDGGFGGGRDIWIMLCGWCGWFGIVHNIHRKKVRCGKGDATGDQLVGNTAQGVLITLFADD